MENLELCSQYIADQSESVQESEIAHDYKKELSNDDTIGHNIAACGASGRYNNLASSYSKLIQANRAIRASGKYNKDGCRIPVNTNFNISFWDEKLINYHDREMTKFLVYGWPINHDGREPCLSTCQNHKGATEFPKQMDICIQKEITEGSSIGPLDPLCFDTPIVHSPLNSRSKRDSTERRLILDLSFPPDRGINQGIDKDSYLGVPARVYLPNVDTLVRFIKQKGQGCALYKRDLRRAYRQIYVDPGDIHLLGFKWNGQSYVDVTLPMGLRSAAYICQRVTNAVRYMCEQEGFTLTNYLDDFAGCENWEDADLAFRTSGEILDKCGLRESVDKACPPATKMVFLGVLFDTDNLTLEITPDRLVEIELELDTWVARTRCNRHDIQELLGKLNFVASCVRPARIFMSRMLAFLRTMPVVGNRVISQDFHKDIIWWRKFMRQYNGVSMMLLDDWSSPDEVLATDACLEGGGAWCEGEYWHNQFPPFILEQGLHINALELLVIVVSIKVWKRKLRGRRLLINCDNSASVEVLNKGKTRDPFLQACLREIEFVAGQGEYEIRARHIPGVDNRLPDLLSRWHKGPEYQAEFIERTSNIHSKEIFIYEGLFKFLHDW